MKKMCIFLPIFVCVFAFIIGGIYNYLPFAIFWWMSIFFILLISLLIISDNIREKKAGNFQNIVTLDISVNKVLYAKMICILGYMLLSTVVLFVSLAVFLKFLYPMLYPTISSNVYVLYSLFKILTALILIIPSMAWILPLLYGLFEYVNGSIMIILSFLISFFIAPIITRMQIWFLFPYAYSYKLIASFLHIDPSGTFHSSLNYGGPVITIATIVLGCIVFTVLLQIDKKIYLRRF